jgi:site-specific recombinase XerC
MPTDGRSKASLNGLITKKSTRPPSSRAPPLNPTNFTNFYATGIRRTEMTNLDHSDYDPSTHTLVVRKGKNGKSRMLPVGQHQPRKEKNN